MSAFKFKQIIVLLIVVVAWAIFINSQFHIISMFYGIMISFVLPVILSVVVLKVVSSKLNQKRTMKNNAEATRVRDQQLSKEHAAARNRKKAIEDRINHYKQDDPVARQVVQFFREIDGISRTIEDAPVKATTYRYAMDYLDFAFSEAQLMKKLTEQAAAEDHDLLFGKYQNFIAQYVPMMQGYNERKAAHLKSLEGGASAAVPGINDI